MYANLSVEYRVVPSPIQESQQNASLLKNFHAFLAGNVITHYSTTTYVYLKSSAAPLADGALGWGSSDYYSHRIAVGANRSSVIAHEIGHSLGAEHFADIVWDSSLGWFGWWGESIMYPIDGGTNSWYWSQEWKYYSSGNRAAVKNTLN